MESLNPYSQIQLRELPTWVKVLSKDTKDKEQIFQDLQLIDDLLVLQKSKSLLNRKKNLRTVLEARISKELKHEKNYQLNNK